MPSILQKANSLHCNARGCIAKCQAFILLNLVIPKPNAAEESTA